MSTTKSRAASQAWESLFRAQVDLRRRFEADEVFDVISFQEYDVLFTLHTGPDTGMRLRDLNRDLLLHQSSLSRLVERLEARGLVERCADESDGRGTLIKLTEQGRRQQRATALAHVRQIAAYVGEALSAEELTQLYTLTAKLRAAQPDIARVANTTTR